MCLDVVKSSNAAEIMCSQISQNEKKNGKKVNVGGGGVKTVMTLECVLT